ncbi:RTC4-like domain-containing protein [Dipodascopsis tothii]|uniref:RTC4-like domain-containing protein n=1 Tax=Dipodascopsis tothii TaxID=44089 RepID=UPI0034CDE131
MAGKRQTTLGQTTAGTDAVPSADKGRPRASSGERAASGSPQKRTASVYDIASSPESAAAAKRKPRPPKTSFATLIRQAKGESDPIVQAAATEPRAAGRAGGESRPARRPQTDDSVDELTKPIETDVSVLRGKFAAWNEQIGDDVFATAAATAATAAAVPTSEADYDDGGFTQSMVAQCDAISEARRLEIESEDAALIATLTADAETAGTAECPLCGQRLSAELRERFARSKKTVRFAYAVCTAHKREDVVRAASGKNYPSQIDEADVVARAEPHMGTLAAIVRDEHPSEFRDRARQRAEATAGTRQDALGQAADDDDTLPGYYGPRGQGIMLRAVLEALSDTIRRASRTQRWIVKLSVSGYATNVLVPELAVRLIMQDRAISERRARKVMRASAEYGRLMFADDEGEGEGEGQERPRERERERRRRRRPRTDEPDSATDAATDPVEPATDPVTDDDAAGLVDLTLHSSPARSIGALPDFDQNMLNFAKIKSQFGRV